MSVRESLIDVELFSDATGGISPMSDAVDPKVIGTTPGAISRRAFIVKRAVGGEEQAKWVS
jgi:hypothetical protein